MRLLICTQTVDIHDPILGFFHRWVEEFAEHFDHIDVICLKEGVHSFPPHVEVHSLGKEVGVGRLTYLVRFYRYFAQLYFVEHVDYVFFHMGAIMNILAAPFYLVRRIRRTKFYWWKTHGHIDRMGRLALRFVDRVYTASKESFPIETKKRRVVGHAIDVAAFSCVRAATHPTPVLLFVGRIMPVKHVEHVIDTIALLRTEGIAVEARIVGSGDNSAYEAHARRRVADLGLGSHVSFLGSRTHAALVSEYCDADLLMNPSETGSIDKVVLEAMACGVIPLATCDPYGELIGAHGLCVLENRPAAYAQSLKVLLARRDTWDEIRKDLTHTVVEGHALSTLTKRIFDLA